VAKPIIDEPVLVDELINSQEDKFVEPVKPPKPPKPKGPNKLNRIKNIFGNLFGESENMDSDMK
jgi:hypothetical protein